jgi:hypothetical protein
MNAVLRSFLSALRPGLQSRASMHLEILALRHQLAVLSAANKQAAEANKEAAEPENRRPLALGVTVAVLESVALSPGDRQAGDSNRVAAKRV